MRLAAVGGVVMRLGAKLRNGRWFTAPRALVFGVSLIGSIALISGGVLARVNCDSVFHGATPRDPIGMTADKTDVLLGETVTFTVGWTSTGVDTASVSNCYRIDEGGDDALNGLVQSFNRTNDVEHLGERGTPQSTTFTVTIPDDASLAGHDLVARAKITHGSRESRSVLVTVSIVGRSSDLTLTLAVDKLTANPGDSLTYTITYTNGAAVSATGVTITDEVPDHTTFVSASGGAVVSEEDGSDIVTWSIGTVAAGGSGQVSLTVVLDDVFPVGTTEVSNTAFISFETDEPQVSAPSRSDGARSRRPVSRRPSNTVVTTVTVVVSSPQPSPSPAPPSPSPSPSAAPSPSESPPSPEPSPESSPEPVTSPSPIVTQVLGEQFSRQEPKPRVLGERLAKTGPETLWIAWLGWMLFLSGVAVRRRAYGVRATARLARPPE